jgi:hypothetical protein
MKIARLFAIAALSLTTVLAHGETTSDSGSSIRIKKIQPSIAQSLKPGEKVAFVVELQYKLAAEAGGAALVIQRAESGHAPLAHAYRKLSQGSGSVTLQAEVMIPDTTTIQIFTPLYHQGGGSTSVVDGRVFEVSAP